MPHVSVRTLGLAVAGAAVLAISSVSAPGGAGAAATAATGYYVVRPACATAAVGHASCFALRRVKATATTVHARKVARPLALPAGPAGGYTPGDLSKAYRVDPTAATSQVIGLVDAYNDPNARDDLNTFDTHYGLAAETATSLKIVSQTGSTSVLPANDGTQSPSSDWGWSTEISLDLDAARGLCNKCRIVLVETESDSTADLAAGVNQAVAQGATEVSNSYGGPESGEQSAAADYDHPGVVITASTGDDGFFNWDVYNTGGTSAGMPDAPASFNTVVAVGGTTLQLNDDGTRSSESVWNENGTYDSSGRAAGRRLGATGGGCSTLFTAQKWQSSVANYAGTTCGTDRLAADVSALADPYTGYDVYDSLQISGVNSCTAPSCWSTFGGTSLASPLVSAMWALAGGSGGVQYPSLSLYGHFRSTSGAFYDVTQGGNGACAGGSVQACGAGGSPNVTGHGTLDCAWQPVSATLAAGTRACDAATGYDGPSGVGTPTGTAGFTAMTPTARIVAPASVTHGKAATFSASSSTDPFPGGTFPKFNWAWGDGTANTVRTAPTHTFAKAGTYIVHMRAYDSYGRSQLTQKKVTVK